MIENFTVEETNFICLFNTESRSKFITQVCDLILDLETDDPLSNDEIFEIAVRVLNKVSKMSDEEFLALELYPIFSDIMEDEEWQPSYN